MRKILKVLIVICIIIIILSIKLVINNRIIINVDDKNREYIMELLGKELRYDSKIYKIGYGREWTHGFIYVYHTSDKTEGLLISEGEFKKGELSDYIIQNGYNQKNLGKLLFFISFTLMVILIILLKIYK